MNEHGQTSRLQCCAIVGAGELMSRILRIDTDACWPEYRYTIELVDAVPGVGSPLFQPADLPSFVNLLRVLTRELIHDGGFEVAEKDWMRQFAELMDVMCDRDLVRQFAASGQKPDDLPTD